MDMARWLLRMARWARHPPSRRQAITAAIVFAVALALYAVEHTAGWPEWLSPGAAPSLRAPVKP